MVSRIGILASLCVIESLTAYSVGTLQIGDVIVEDTRVVVPVVLGGDTEQGVGALDFRLDYDPNRLTPVSVEAGTAAASADKHVMANASEPGEYIVVMMGMNQTACESGEVARIVMERAAGASDDALGLSLRDPTLSSVEGIPIDGMALPYEEAQTDDATQGNTRDSQDTAAATPNPVAPASSAADAGGDDLDASAEAGPLPALGRADDRRTEPVMERAARLAKAAAQLKETRGLIPTPPGADEALDAAQPEQRDNSPAGSPEGDAEIATGEKGISGASLRLKSPRQPDTIVEGFGASGTVEPTSQHSADTFEAQALSWRRVGIALLAAAGGMAMLAVARRFVAKLFS